MGKYNASLTEKRKVDERLEGTMEWGWVFGGDYFRSKCMMNSNKSKDLGTTTKTKTTTTVKDNCKSNGHRTDLECTHHPSHPLAR
jgi:hypothetical protein